MGICLQFEWVPPETDDGRQDAPVFCSVDLVPTFKIEEIEAIDLARIINTAMLGAGQPKGWYNHMKNYVKGDMVLEDTFQGSGTVKAVLLKHLSCFSEKNYYVRPGQNLGPVKFQTRNLKRAYCYIKALKKIRKVSDLDMYLVKKDFKKEVFLALDRETTYFDDFFFKVLSQPVLKSKFESVINYPQWGRRHNKYEIPLR